VAIRARCDPHDHGVASNVSSAVHFEGLEIPVGEEFRKRPVSFIPRAACSDLWGSPNQIPTIFCRDRGESTIDEVQRKHLPRETDRIADRQGHSKRERACHDPLKVQFHGEDVASVLIVAAQTTRTVPYNRRSTQDHGHDRRCARDRGHGRRPALDRGPQNTKWSLMIGVAEH
jgi:hypothetical protein